MTDAKLEIKWRGETIYVSLSQVQQILDGIYSDYSNSELWAMLDMFVSDFHREAIRATEEGLIRQMQHDMTQDYKSE